MRRSIVVIILAIASPLAASWWPTWTPSEVRMAVGETVFVREQAKWSGLVDYAGGIHWTFRTDNEQVAIAAARINSSAPYDVAIRAVGPGTATIREVNSNGQLDGIVPWVRITVVCGDEPPVRAPSEPLRGRIHQPMTLSVLSDISDRTSYLWYAGRAGDASKPIAASGPEIVYTPQSYGMQYVWVTAKTACAVSNAEFAIEVPRRRPSR